MNGVSGSVADTLNVEDSYFLHVVMLYLSKFKTNTWESVFDATKTCWEMGKPVKRNNMGMWNSTKCQSAVYDKVQCGWEK